MHESNCLANKMSGINYNIMTTQILIASLVGREIAASGGHEKKIQTVQPNVVFYVFYNARNLPEVMCFWLLVK